MYRQRPSNILILRGEKGRQIYKEIANMKPKKIDIEARKEELKKKLAEQGYFV